MEWSSLYSNAETLGYEQIESYISCPLFSELNNTLKSVYNIEPSIEYSSCSLMRDWNLKYKKNGKSLCTIYPAEGYFTVLVALGKKDTPEAEILIPLCSAYVQEVFNRTVTFNGQKWLMIDVKDESAVTDILKLIYIKKPPKKAK